jgi:hypothetical protein
MKTFKTPKGTELPFLDLRGKQYLQVMHRLVWFREEHPKWTIKTALIESNENHSIFKAEILDDDDRLIQTGFGREDAKHFPDHVEKAETKSIGRALAACGFGTQFAPELDEGHRLADSPSPQKPAFQRQAEVLGKAPYAQQAANKPSSDPGSYKIEFGKYKGASISESYDELGEYIEYLERAARQEGKPLSVLGARLIENYTAYKALNAFKPKQPEPPPHEDGDLPF